MRRDSALVEDVLLVRSLAEDPVFRQLEAGDRERIADYLERVTYGPGEVIVSENDEDRDAYLVLEGEARIVRGQLEVGTLGPGDHFGELALLAARPRAASVIARTEMVLARMSAEEYEEMAASDSKLALRFLRVIIDALGERLSDMTASVDQLLHERSLPRRTRVEVKLCGKPLEVRTGTTLRELLPETCDGDLVVGGLVDRRRAPRRGARRWSSIWAGIASTPAAIISKASRPSGAASCSKTLSR